MAKQPEHDWTGEFLEAYAQERTIHRAAVAAGVLLPMVARTGEIGLEHRRWWLIPDAALGLALAVALPPACRFASLAPRVTTLALGAVVLGFTTNLRVPAARADVLEGKCWSSPALADGQLYLRSTEQAARLDLR